MRIESSPQPLEDGIDSGEHQEENEVALDREAGELARDIEHDVASMRPEEVRTLLQLLRRNRVARGLAAAIVLVGSWVAKGSFAAPESSRSAQYQSHTPESAPPPPGMESVPGEDAQRSEWAPEYMPPETSERADVQVEQALHDAQAERDRVRGDGVDGEPVMVFSITGTASIEGESGRNAQLSAERAQLAAEHLAERLQREGVPDDGYVVVYDGAGEAVSVDGQQLSERDALQEVKQRGGFSSDRDVWRWVDGMNAGTPAPQDETPERLELFETFFASQRGIQIAWEVVPGAASDMDVSPDGTAPQENASIPIQNDVDAILPRTQQVPLPEEAFSDDESEGDGSFPGARSSSSGRSRVSFGAGGGTPPAEDLKGGRGVAPGDVRDGGRGGEWLPSDDSRPPSDSGRGRGRAGGTAPTDIRTPGDGVDDPVQPGSGTRRGPRPPGQGPWPPGEPGHGPTSENDGKKPPRDGDDEPQPPIDPPPPPPWPPIPPPLPPIDGIRVDPLPPPPLEPLAPPRAGSRELGPMKTERVTRGRRTRGTEKLPRRTGKSHRSTGREDVQLSEDGESIPLDASQYGPRERAAQGDDRSDEEKREAKRRRTARSLKRRQQGKDGIA